jgi:hypothetical protein
MKNASHLLLGEFELEERPAEFLQGEVAPEKPVGPGCHGRGTKGRELGMETAQFAQKGGMRPQVILLVILLGRIESPERCNLGEDGALSLLFFTGEGLFCTLLLLRTFIKHSCPILP